MATILWLDDAFRPKDDSSTKTEKLNWERINGWKKELEGIIGENIIANDNYNEFYYEIHHCRKLDVIAILNTTAFMLSADKEEEQKDKPSLEAFFKAKNKCLKYKVPFIIFSDFKQEGGGSLLHNKVFSLECKVGCWPPKDCISKDEDNRIGILGEALQKELEHSPWQRFEFMEYLIKNEYLDAGDEERGHLVRIIRSYGNVDISNDFEPFDIAFKGTMRKLLESLLNTIKNRCIEEGKTNCYKKKGELKNLNELEKNDLKDYICRGCSKSYYKQYFPLKICPQPIKNALDFLWESLNNGMHTQIDESSMTKKDKDTMSTFDNFFKDDRERFAKSYARILYDSFFLVMRWYSIFMEEKLYLKLPVY